MPIEHLDVVQNDVTSYFEQMRAAPVRAEQLSLETGIEHASRWHKADSRYVISPLPFIAPDKPWDETNRPERRRTDWDRMPSKQATLDELIIAVASLSGRQWMSATDYPKDPATFVRDLQAALDLQYGRGHFWASRHGHRISVQCRYPV